MKENTLLINNETRKKTLRKPGSKIGLQNLAERYKLITGKEIIIQDANNTFTVLLPLLKIE